MGNSKWMHVNITQLKFFVYLDFMVKSFRHFPEIFIITDSLNRSRCSIDRDLIFSTEYTKSLNMICMFMGNQDSIQLFPFYFKFL